MNFKYDKDSIKIIDRKGNCVLDLSFFGGKLFLQDIKNKKMIDIIGQMNSKSITMSQLSDIKRRISFIEPSSFKIVLNKPDKIIKLNYYKYTNFDIHHGGGNLHLASPTDIIEDKEGKIIIHTRGFNRTITFGEKYLLHDNLDKRIHNAVGLSIFRYIITNNYICIEDVKHYPLP